MLPAPAALAIPLGVPAREVTVLRIGALEVVAEVEQRERVGFGVVFREPNFQRDRAAEIFGNHEHRTLLTEEEAGVVAGGIHVAVALAQAVRFPAEIARVVVLGHALYKGVYSQMNHVTSMHANLVGVLNRIELVDRSNAYREAAGRSRSGRKGGRIIWAGNIICGRGCQSGGCGGGSRRAASILAAGGKRREDCDGGPETRRQKLRHRKFSCGLWGREPR